MKNQIIKDKVLELLKANNTITTLEVKIELRKRGSVNQEVVSEVLKEMADNGELIFTDNGTYRIYSLPLTKSVAKLLKVVVINTIEKIKINAAIELLKANTGKMLTIVFTKKDHSLKISNGQFRNKINQLGYYSFKEKGSDYKQFDPKKLKEIRVNKKVYEVEYN